MAKKLIILTLGTVLMSSAWMGIVSAVKSSQDAAYKESLPLKFSVVQSKWARLLNFDPVKSGKVMKPAAFVFTLDAMELKLLDFQSPAGMIRSDLSDFKTAYLDAGKKSPFFSVNAQDGRHLVRAVRDGDKIKLIGYSLDSVLNFLGARLEDSEWFLMDSKNRILAAHQGAYVGQPYKFDGTTQKFKFEQNKHRFTFAIQKPKGASLAMVNFLGVLGIFLIAGALFIYKDDSEEVDATTIVAAPALKTNTAGESLKDNLGLDKSVSIQEKDFNVDGVLDKGLESGVEDIQMVNLQDKTGAGEANSQEAARLDYTEFLIDNPVLRPGNIKQPARSVVQVNTQAKAALTEQSLEMPVKEVRQDDWVKMAEELSANIDKFTKSIEEDKIEKKSTKEA